MPLCFCKDEARSAPGNPGLVTAAAQAVRHEGRTFVPFGLPCFAIAGHLMDLVSLGLGARGETAVAARRGGVRAVRLKAVLMIRHGRPVGTLCQRAVVRGRR